MKRRYIVQLCLALLLCCPSLLKAQSSQTNFQYWIDDNKDEAVYGTVNGEDIDLSIDVSSLSAGVHFYNIRSYETVGTKKKWGTIYRSLFCIPRPQNDVADRLITGYSYSFNDNSPTNVVFDAPVEEYALTNTFNVPQVQKPMVIDDDCSFMFDEDENTATLSRNVNMSFSLFFKDQSNAVCSPVTTDFVVADLLTEDIQTITSPGSATIVSHEGGGFSAICFDVTTTMNLKLTVDGNCSLRLYSPYSQLLDSYDASALKNGAIREYEEGTYYAIVYGNPTEVELSLAPADMNALKPTIAFDMDTHVVTISCTTAGATIHYTLDGTTPTAESSLYKEPFTIERNCIVKAIATWSNTLISPVATRGIDIFDVAVPVIAHDGNTVTITCDTEGATIYYTTDGKEPTAESTVYREGFTVTENCTIKAIAVKEGYHASVVTSYQFSYIQPVVTMPQIAYEGNTITITCNTEGAAIYYTLDGTEPTVESIAYTEAFDVDKNCTIKAIALKEGYNVSTVATLDVDWLNVCGYAIFDSSTGLLTFKYGPMPVGDNVWETEHLILDNYAFAPWRSDDLKKVVFDASYAQARPVSTAWWFFGNTNLSEIVGIEYLNTSEVTNMRGMFYGCKYLTTIDVTHFDTRNVTNMAELFGSCGGLLSIDLSNFNTSKVEYFSSMFFGCKNLTSLDLSSFDTKNATRFHQLFSGCNNLKTIYVSDKWIVGDIEAGDYVFTDCKSLVGGMGTMYDSKCTDYTYAHIDGGANNPGYFTLVGCEPYEPELCGYAIYDSNTGLLTFKYGPMPVGDNVWETEHLILDNYAFAPWRSDDLKKVVFDASYAQARPVSTAWWFFGNTNLSEIVGIEYLNTSEVTNMRGMFYGCKDLTTIDVTHFDTRNVTNMAELFGSCGGLLSIDLSNFNTSKVEYFSSMFFGCKNLTSLDLSSFDTKNATRFHQLFSGCNNLKTIYVSDKWIVGDIEAGDYVFTDCKSLVGGMGTMYDSKCTNYTYAHIDGGVDNPGYFTKTGEPVPVLCGYAIVDKDAGTLTFKYGLKPSGNNVYETDHTDFKSYESHNPWYFKDQLKTVIFDASFAKARPVSTAGWFYDAKNLSSIIGIQYLNTEQVKDMSWMFCHCSGLTSLDLTHFNTSKVTDMAFMFCTCSNMKTVDLSSFNTENVTDMTCMFASCYSLTSLDLSSFDTRNVTNMSTMFSGYRLETLDLSNFNTTNVTTMESMFANCPNLVTLDISGFNTTRGPSMYQMFFNDQKLTTVYVGEDWTAQYSNDFFMLIYCYSLVGGKGTTYDGTKLGKEYARIDGGADSPGYFTYKGATTLLIGDVNGDGSISVTDVGMMISFILGQNPSGFNEDAADMNGDGTISVTDVGALITKILTGE